MKKKKERTPVLRRVAYLKSTSRLTLLFQPLRLQYRYVYECRATQVSGEVGGISRSLYLNSMHWLYPLHKSWHWQLTQARPSAGLFSIHVILMTEIFI